MTSPSLVRYLRALERTPPATRRSNRNVRFPEELLTEAGKIQKQTDDQRIAALKQQYTKNNPPKEKRAAKSAADKKTADNTRGKKAEAIKSKEQAGSQTQGTLLQIWSQQKPTSKSRTLEEDDEEPRKGIKRQRIF